MGIDRIYVQNQLINEDNMEISYIYIYIYIYVCECVCVCLKMNIYI